jgi:hypothetical protein
MFIHMNTVPTELEPSRVKKTGLDTEQLNYM